MTVSLQNLESVIVTILAVLFVFYTAMRVGAMRHKHDIRAPATSGHPEFDRAFRVQMNTLENFAVFLPLFWIATLLFRSVAYVVPATGILWVIGRILYMTGYMKAPEMRGTGGIITTLAEAILLVLCIIGLIRAWSVETAV
jgi:glutathione S-transferase